MSDNSPANLDVLVLGAVAMDQLVYVNHLPQKDGIVLAQRVDMQPGGSGANVAVAIARLGFKTGFAARISSDENGQTLLHAFEQAGIDTRACLIDSARPTALCFIMIDAAGDRSMVALGGAGPFETITELFSANLPKARLVYMTDLQPQIAQAVLTLARANGSKVVFSPGGIVCSQGLQPLTELIPQTDVLLLSRSEASSLLPDCPPEQAPEILCRQGARSVVVTLGERGAAYANPQNSFILPAMPVHQVVDTTGAGDAFAGGMIAGLLRGKPLETAIRFGSVAAALKVSKGGARSGLPSMLELESLL